MSWLEALARDGGSKPKDDDWVASLTQSGEEVLLVCSLTLADYLQLSITERAALVCAAMRLQAGRAAQIGRAARSELGEAEVLAELDGGEAYDQALADQAFKQVTNARPK